MFVQVEPEGFYFVLCFSARFGLGGIAECVEVSKVAVTVVAVKVWKSILTLCLLAVWLPATAHCGLEAVGLVPLDECCESAPNGDHKSDNACKVLEDSGYKAECAAKLPSPPEIFVILATITVLPSTVVMDGLEIVQGTFETHFLPQFVIQTALPIRGPSSAS